MKSKKLLLVILLGAFIAALASADAFLYLRGKQTVSRVDVVNAETAADTGEEAVTAAIDMKDFTVTDASKRITVDRSVLDGSEEEASDGKNASDGSGEEAADGENASDENNGGEDTEGIVGLADAGGYIFEDSDSAYLRTSDVKGLSKRKLRLARNELYARHGYIFGDEELAAYFKKKDWYSERISGEDFRDSDVFNKYEIANRNLILKYEKKKK